MRIRKLLVLGLVLTSGSSLFAEDQNQSALIGYRISRLPPDEFKKSIESRLPAPPIRSMQDHLRKGVSEDSFTYDVPSKQMKVFRPSNTNFISASSSLEYVCQTAQKKAVGSAGGLFIYKLKGAGVITPYSENPIYEVEPDDYENKAASLALEAPLNEEEVTFDKGANAPAVLEVYYVDQKGGLHKPFTEYGEGAYTRLPHNHPGLRENWVPPYPALGKTHPANWPPWDPAPPPKVAAPVAVSPKRSFLGSLCGRFTGLLVGVSR